MSTPAAPKPGGTDGPSGTGSGGGDKPPPKPTGTATPTPSPSTTGSTPATSTTSTSSTTPTSTTPAPVPASAPPPTESARSLLRAVLKDQVEFNFYWEGRSSLTTKAIRVGVHGVELIINVHPGTDTTGEYLFGFGSAYVRGDEDNEVNIGSLGQGALAPLRDQLAEQFHAQFTEAYDKLEAAPRSSDRDWRNKDGKTRK